ncbi:hypothetical protein C0995_003283 [Termitomyces sp. Mi166|nr:hypothetical protein C0995_003283 [Termitomyces sp. Mi166\
MPEARPFDPSSPFSSTASSSSLPSNQPWGSSGSSSSPHRQYMSSPFLGAEEPGFITIQSLFREATLLPLSFGHPSRPAPAVLSAVYLWGVHLSQSEALLQQEQSFILRALQHAVTGMFGSHPDIILHTLQAEVLLSYYLLRVGRFIEAKCHTATAVSLAFGAGLHKTRSVHLTVPPTLGLSSDIPFSLPPPHDNVEEGERIDGFWTVMVLHKYITVVLEPSTSICGTSEALGIQVDTPWPLDISDYSGGLGPDVRGNDTIRNFWINTVETGHGGQSITAHNAKAAILFHRSAQLAGQWMPTDLMLDMQPREYSSYVGTLQLVHQFIKTFCACLPPLIELDIKNPLARKLILIHALADAATIKLHLNFFYDNSPSRQYCLAAARRIVTSGGHNILEGRHMNPIMDTLLMTACHVFINEISRVRSLGNTWLTNAEGSEDGFMEYLKSGMAILSARSDESAFTSTLAAWFME